MPVDRIELTWGEVLEKLVQRTAPWVAMSKDQKTTFAKACKRYVNKTTRDRVLMTWDRLGKAVLTTGDAVEAHYRRSVGSKQGGGRVVAPSDLARHYEGKAERAAKLDRKEQMAAVEDLFEPLMQAVRKLEAPAVPGFLEKANQLLVQINEPIEDWLFEEISEQVAELNRNYQVLSKLQQAKEEVSR